MTLISDLMSAYSAAMPTEQGQPPVPYTTAADTYSAVGNLWYGGDRAAQLDATTGESTLFSVLQLIAQETAAVKWYGERATTNPAPDQEPPRVTGEQNLAVKLWDRPNRFMSGKFMRTMCTWHYRAVGEMWWVVDYFGDGSKPGGMPRSFWPVRPDRMWPVPDPDEYLLGYIYVGPDGQRVPLELHEVLSFKFPHPMDPHRGLGAVQALGRTLGISMSSQEWIAKFFQNDASPGGIIEIPEGLEDGDYERLRKRWNEQHRGVSKAHRVAILEWGTFKPRSFNMRDMQFAEVRQLTRDQVLETLRVHKHKMGISDTVNLANAYAADVTFARSEVVPNLTEWSDLANGPYLELFGNPGKQVRLCHENPVEEDREQERADRTAKINDGITLINNGVAPAEAWEYVGLPEFTMTRVAAEESQAPVVDGVPAGAPDPVEAPAGSPTGMDPLAIANIVQKLYIGTKSKTVLTEVEARTLVAAAGMPINPGDWQEPEPEPAPVVPFPAPAPPAEVVPAARRHGPRAQSAPQVDLSQLDEDWQTALDGVLARWPGILDDQYSALAQQVRDAVASGDLAALAALSTPDSGAAEVLTGVLVTAAAAGAAALVAEAAAQGVMISAAVPARESLETLAGLVTGLMRAGLATSAGREAVRLAAGGNLGADDVADAVRLHLDGLTEAGPRMSLGGAVTAAQNQGRFSTLDIAPHAGYYAAEVLDTNTCGPCTRVADTRYGTLAAAKEDYPLGGYRKCAGGERCRGTIVAIWEEADGGG